MDAFTTLSSLTRTGHPNAGAPPQALERVAQVPEQAVAAAAALLRATRSAAAVHCIRRVAAQMGPERAAASQALAGADAVLRAYTIHIAGLYRPAVAFRGPISLTAG